MPIDIGEHELECSRVSYWKCKECDSYFELTVPMSKLRTVKRGTVKNTIINKLVDKFSVL